jgi:hypothetical protein
MGHYAFRSVALIALMCACGGCAIRDADLALRAKSELIGLPENDLRMCAGHPTNEDNIPGGKIWMYEHADAVPTGVTITPALPLGTVLTPPNGGYCRVQFRIVHAKVAEVTYAGATDQWGRRDAGCAPIVRSCLDYKADHSK